MALEMLVWLRVGGVCVLRTGWCERTIRGWERSGMMRGMRAWSGKM
jgi:hypothetical protein